MNQNSKNTPSSEKDGEKKCEKKASSKSRANFRRSGSKSRTPNSKNKAFKSIAWTANTKFNSSSIANDDFLENSLSSSNFVVFDIETTGGNPEKNGITEIFCVKYRNGQQLGTFYSLVNPLIPIPHIVRKMTGITNHMVKDAPKIEEIINDLIAFIGDDILVSHNTIGDLKFLKYFSYSGAGHNLDNYFLCTHLLSEKLISDAPDKSLKGLCDYLGFSRDASHRAEADTYMTLDLFREILNRLDQKGIFKVKQAVRFQGDLESSLRLGWGVKDVSYNSYPQAPGLFFLYDRDDSLLFFSSSTNLRKDVRGLTNYNQLPRQLLRKVLSTYRIETKQSSHFLEAFIEEASDKRRQKLSYRPSQWHLKMIYAVQGVKDGNHYLVSVGRPSSEADFIYGKIFDRKEAFLLLKNIADAIGADFNRKGLIADLQQYQLVKNYFQGTLPDLSEELTRSRWNPFNFFNAKKSSDIKQKRGLLGKLGSLPRFGFGSLDNVHGFATVRTKSTNRQGVEIFPVFKGIIQDARFFEGNFEDWKSTDEAAGLILAMEKSSTDGEKPEKDEGRLNVGLWVATLKYKKNEHDIQFEAFPFDRGDESEIDS